MKRNPERCPSVSGKIVESHSISSSIAGHLSDHARLAARITQALAGRAEKTETYGRVAEDFATASAVLLLIGPCGAAPGRPEEVCLILNKRSARVRQPGDLCCPGGSVSPRIDFFLGRLLGLPLSPLGRWPLWRRWRRQRPIEARWLALFLATGLREAFEEMRLNPLRARFLGPLPQHRLVLFRRSIYPLAAWVSARAAFRPNWEVQSVVRIPLRQLLDPEGYVRYRLKMAWNGSSASGQTPSDYPGFRFRDAAGQEVLWGATYRIVTIFLETVFDFAPPPLESLPVVEGHLGDVYLTGERC
jgi:hypothetical protein